MYIVLVVIREETVLHFRLDLVLITSFLGLFGTLYRRG